MNEFINNHLECIDMPISNGRLQGFLLNNGFRIFFRNNERLLPKKKDEYQRKTVYRWPSIRAFK
mgnify:CR=1 FL=1